ncbi:MAG TPA: ABC transporter ATP-binding protein [Syntrophales bacterium]|nr:ABC transporter ATP-binding protein [Syntrophales bacterium]HOU77509.1 ABC transporter ATP-binding protein [Syntrophales bacterium]HRR46608.1 ABC transporter ATP-binding protein [Syntrophales bacterium]
MNNTPILQGRDLQVRRGGRLILDVSSLDIAAGEVLSVIGPNGAGKTTLLQALAGLLRLERGEISFAGEKVGTDIAPLVYRRQLAMVFQEALLFDATVYANVAAGLRLRGTAAGETKKIVAARLEQFGIGHLHDRSAKTLSGGEAQRTSLARAFAVKPQILFLDEPFAALDPPTREALIDDLGRILRESGTTAVMATHDQGEALRLSDRIAVMQDGRIAQLGTPMAVMNHPANESVAAFVGVETILAGRVVKYERGTVTVAVAVPGGRGEMPAAPGTEPPAGGGPRYDAAAIFPGIDGREATASPAAAVLEAAGEVREGEQVLCCIRPEHVTITPGLHPSRTSARNAFPGVIDRIIPAGPFYKLHVRGGLPLTAYITVQSLEELGLREGGAVTASFKATAVHLLRRG